MIGRTSGGARRALPLGVFTVLALILPLSGLQPVAAASKQSIVSVSIKNYSFGKGIVRIHRGQTVVWTNRDPDLHTVSSNPGSGVSFSSSPLKQGHSFRFTFKKDGTFHYHCAFHAFMHGEVIVTG